MLTQNYFALFELPENFNLDESALAAQYRQLQLRVHPDKFAGHTDQEQRLAVQFSAFVNQAYNCLRSPVKRAAYLLELRGLQAAFDTMTIADSAFLLQQMQLREDLMEARNTSDPTAAFDKLRQTAEFLSAQIQLDFTNAFESNQLPSAQEAVAKLFFVEKFLANIHQLEDQLFNEL